MVDVIHPIRVGEVVEVEVVPCANDAIDLLLSL